MDQMRRAFWSEIPSGSNPEKYGAIVDERVDTFIAHHPGMELHSYGSKDGVCMILVDNKEFPFPAEFARELVEYVKKNEAPLGGRGRVDCRQVAERAIGARLADGYFEVGAPLMSEREYEFHAANYLEPQPRYDKSDRRGKYRGKMYLAFDLTAEYNLNAERKGGYRVLIIAAGSKETLQEYVKEFYAGDTTYDRRSLLAAEQLQDKWQRLSSKYLISIDFDPNREGYPEFLTRIEAQLEALDERRKKKVQNARITYSGGLKARVKLYGFKFFSRTLGKREDEISLENNGALAAFIG